MTAPRPLATWFAALLAADVTVAVIAGLLLGRAGVASDLLGSATAGAMGVAPALIGGGAAIGAHRLWRRGADAAAMALAMLPMVLGVPYVFATLGLPF